MPIPKKWFPVLYFLALIVFLQFFRKIVWVFQPIPDETLNPIPNPSPILDIDSPRLDFKPRLPHHQQTDEHYQTPLLPISKTEFKNGTLKPLGHPYTKTIVLPLAKDEDVSWVDENFGGDEYIRSSIYNVDNSSVGLHPPRNKGHEAMVYLSYIIDYYDNLTDVNIFMHSHRYAWHNDPLMDIDAVQMISRLSAERVQREGYMNMRCNWEPGCPSWIRPGATSEDINKQEEVQLARSWMQLFPHDTVPEVLAQPCCAQFAISRDRIRSLPLARYISFRDWLLHTDLSDYISGRVWEYMWQFVFTGHNVVCPEEHVCYCDGFGVCFGGKAEYDAYNERDKERERLEEELWKWQENADLIDRLKQEGKNDEVAVIGEPEVGKDLELEGRIEGLKAWCGWRRMLAKVHGDIAPNRALEAGREWRDGDGF